MDFATYCHRVLHVSHSRGELAEVQLGAVDQRVSEIPAAAARTHNCSFPLLTVCHHSCVVLSCGDSLSNRNKETSAMKQHLPHSTECVDLGTCSGWFSESHPPVHLSV